MMINRTDLKDTFSRSISIFPQLFEKINTFEQIMSFFVIFTLGFRANNAFDYQSLLNVFSCH